MFQSSSHEVHCTTDPSSPQTFLTQNAVLAEDRFQLHPDSDPTHTSKTTEHQLVERVLIFEIVID